MNILDLKSNTCDANTRLLITKYNSNDSNTSLEQESSIVPTPMNSPTVECVISCKPVMPISHSDSEDEDDIPDINWNNKPVIYQINLQFLMDMEDVIRKASMMDQIEIRTNKEKQKPKKNKKEKQKPKENKNEKQKPKKNKNEKQKESKKRVSLSLLEEHTLSVQKPKTSKRKKILSEEELPQSQN